MHRPFIALVSAIAFTCALAASIVALIPSSWIPIEASAAEVGEGRRLFDHEPSAATAAPAEPATRVMTARSALTKLVSAFWRTPPTPYFVMTASTIFSAARPA
jgi:hypothetical protein